MSYGWMAGNLRMRYEGLEQKSCNEGGNEDMEVVGVMGFSGF